MTGYVKADYEDQVCRISVEVKAINAKYADVALRFPKVFSAQEITWRDRVVHVLQRGKIAVLVTYARKDAVLPAVSVNQALFKHYYQVLQTLAAETGDVPSSLMPLVFKFPEVVVQPKSANAQQEDLQVLATALKSALAQCDKSRQQEGVALARSIATYVTNIEQCLARIAKLSAARNSMLKERLAENIKRSAIDQLVDQHRLAQEVLYHVERLDITEEQVRLRRHLHYFSEVMQGSQAAGKKLGFIAQEIGREINTMGAKANHATIQKEVVLMKEALEKIKEQLLNIL